ncbi:MAG: rhamnan synthesis F family protein [Burkholderiales bacterium]|jgi:lipopolysaccharide biosynthesis protein|nr:rhamnan synthesis F family protein [Burkholderiales bacterium]
MKDFCPESDGGDDAQARIHWLKTRNADLEDKCFQLKNANKALSAELRSVYGSHSWKLTAPLRHAATCARKILGRRFALLAPDPLWPPEVKALEKKLTLKDASSPSAIPLGVFMHIYYMELAEEMLDLLDHLPSTAKIHISTDDEAKRQKLLQLGKERNIDRRVQVRVCPNLGWDLAPFLVGFADEIPQYPLILRLHSKRSTQLPETTGTSWRKMLFASLCGSKERVNAIMRAFADAPRLGMVCPPTVAHNVNDVHFGGNFQRMRKLLEPHGVIVHEDTTIDFPVGSMFWCRPETLRPWLDRRFVFEDFRHSGEDERDGSLAHALERLLLFGCGITGFSWARVPELPAPDKKNKTRA